MVNNLSSQIGDSEETLQIGLVFLFESICSEDHVYFIEFL